MSFETEIKEFSKQIKNKINHIDSEETTKLSLILPFLRLMGYDDANPSEVRAEYTADIGTKQGEKVDIAILEDNNPIIFIECKSANNKLNEDHISQLFRYFSITDIQIGILTNGVEYKFFTTGEDNNKMDEKPFLDIDLLHLTKKDIKELEKFIKTNFNIDEVITRADDLKYRNSIKKILLDEFEEPSEEFVKVIGRQAYDGILTPAIKEKFSSIISNVTAEIINEKVDKRLSDAVNTTIVSETKQSSLDESVTPKKEEEIVKDDVDVKVNDIITTDEELEGLFIIKSIAAEVTDVDRITIRDRLSYCNILLDDHQYYPIIRLHFNNVNNLRIGLFDNFEKRDSGTKIEDKIDIEKVSDIYKYKDRILKLIKTYIDIKDSEN